MSADVAGDGRSPPAANPTTSPPLGLPKPFFNTQDRSADHLTRSAVRVRKNDRRAMNRLHAHPLMLYDPHYQTRLYERPTVTTDGGGRAYQFPY